METTRAILLRRTKLTESSWVLTWLTASHGKLKTVAKGARKPKSRFAGQLDLFYECEVQFARSARSELHSLREVELTEPHDAIRLDYSRVALASYFIELLELVTEPEHPVPELFDLLRRALKFLAGNQANERALLHYESELARLLGVQQPSVAAVVALGRVYHRLPEARPALLKRLRERDAPPVR